MNQTLDTRSAADVPWPTSDQRLRPASDTSMRNGGVSQAVHELADGVCAAEAALHDKADDLRATGGAWVESVRTTVRSNPLACLAAAVAAGAVISRLTRSLRDTGDTH